MIFWQENQLLWSFSRHFWTWVYIGTTVPSLEFGYLGGKACKKRSFRVFSDKKTA